MAYFDLTKPIYLLDILFQWCIFNTAATHIRLTTNSYNFPMRHIARNMVALRFILCYALSVDTFLASNNETHQRNFERQKNYKRMM